MISKEDSKKWAVVDTKMNRYETCSSEDEALETLDKMVS